MKAYLFARVSGKLLPAHDTSWVVATSVALLHMCRAIFSFLALADNDGHQERCWVLQFKPHTFPDRSLHCSFWGITKDGSRLVCADLLDFSFNEMASYLSSLVGGSDACCSVIAGRCLSSSCQSLKLFGWSSQNIQSRFSCAIVT